MLVAYFLLVLVSYQGWPVMLGPYTFDQCMEVKTYLREYPASNCELLPLPQEDARPATIPFTP